MSTKRITKKQADALWAELREALANAERAIIAIIESEAWKPLGYSTFAEAWQARGLTDITVGAELRPHVIYQLLAEGMPEDEIAETVKGVGAPTVTGYKRQRAAGVPASKAQPVTVRKHGRARPCPPSTIRIEVGATKYREYKKIADDYGMTVDQIAAEAISERFDMLLAVESRRQS